MNKASDVLKNSPSLLTSFLQKSDNSSHAGGDYYRINSACKEE